MSAHYRKQANFHAKNSPFDERLSQPYLVLSVNELTKEVFMSLLKKTFITIIFLMSGLSTSVFAHGYGGWRRHGGGRYWVVPAIVAGAIAYDVLQPRVIQAAPPVVIVPPAQNVQSTSVAPPAWYYCQSSESYYPSVQTCDEPWKIVPASPPPSN